MNLIKNIHNSNNKNKVRALGLCSGGLDSILSALLLRHQGIEVFWISFETPFFSSDKAKCAADKNNIPLYIRNITRTYMSMITDPKCKFGKNINPCMDCHSLMFKIAGNIMIEYNFDFMFSGEVLGQRPMSQKKNSLRYVEKKSGFPGHILRPLSAKLLPTTIPEEKKRVNSDLLMSIRGRSRKQQIALAGKLGLKDFPSPGGGCLLTDKSYSHRLQDLLSHQNIFPENELHLLRFGRHMRLNNKIKIVIGRNFAENNMIEFYADLASDIVIKTCKVPGPVVVVPKGRTNATFETLKLAASICAGYSKVKKGNVSVCINSNGNYEYIETEILSIPKSRNFLIL